VRCFGDGDPLYERYHDDEWGRPVLEENSIFERVSLEAFQSGLSWITVLRKRDNFRRAFHGFVPERIAVMDDSDVKELLGDEGIIRNRAKIEATIANARALLQLHRSGSSLRALFWDLAPRATVAAPRSFADVPAFSDDAKTLSRHLKKLGFRFVGPTTLYAAFQAIGVVNDHLAGCSVRRAVETERRSALESIEAGRPTA
jgi:DNA-3-methyladenine glycosylase I